jgi:hypothetical protein
MYTIIYISQPNTSIPYPPIQIETFKTEKLALTRYNQLLNQLKQTPITIYQIQILKNGNPIYIE